MSTLVTALIAAAAVAAVYFFCLRPMRQGRCGMMGGSRDAELDRRIADLREEIRVLRAQDSLDSGQVPTTRPSPPADT
ncbi:hypothetical protein SAMN05421810_101828 [Amycolatopsis arida]|uniref:Uncharacterized protein n=1 Tax=Amycolatopsis arida TaxID=587909 RepID=A0A1I5M7X4_9PSEU|nr:hypothetical protein [Amycolatopsis arida]TDX94002.1 hypothetical protein CLV69_104460 [Amycolatopsis arida]SFP05615.1 hypothetical protein SAMN05421810_101828 [Amycolatopsis arida]